MAQFGSALEWGSRGRKFNSCHPDQQAKLSLLRAKKRRLHRRFFLLFFASLCPSQKTRQSEMRDARKCSLFRRFAPYNSCHPDHAKEQRQICSIFFAKNSALCLAPSLFAKSLLFASRSLRSPKIRLLYN